MIDKMTATVEAFAKTIKKHNVDLSRAATSTLQVNIGKLCNQACLHCHVEAGPKRTEIMELKTVERILALIQKSKSIMTVDITGGAPELNPHFRFLAKSLREMGKTVIDRCNLTVLYEKGQETTAAFLREMRINIVASLPCYQKENVEKQRGRGVFDRSISALKLLNSMGYGKKDSGLVLDLVYNPIGASLPPAQEKLEKSYKRELKELFDIEFNRLYTITNMPIKRFLTQLEREKRYDEYMTLLLNNFNPSAAGEVMCRNLFSVGWDGQLYDCDFNQMLEMKIPSKKDIWNIQSFNELEKDAIRLDNHCYGCTAGAGSSCGGSLT